MDTTQQAETRAFFERVAAEWRRRATDSRPEQVSVIAQRNDCVLECARRLARRTRALDVGCGTGELVRALARAGFQATGVDFAPAMVDLARAGAAAEGVTGAEFVRASIFEYEPAGRFDLVSANGFVEYVSPEQLATFLALVRRVLAPGGRFVIGSRNRLFNALSLNEYTDLEVALGAHAALVAEARAIVGAPSLEHCLATLAAMRPDLPAVGRHPGTGIAVTTRHQYTPAQLVGACRDAGLAPTGLCPVHYHAAPPRFRAEFPEQHALLANLMQTHAGRAFYLVPQASTFMLEGTAGAGAPPG